MYLCVYVSRCASEVCAVAHVGTNNGKDKRIHPMSVRQDRTGQAGRDRAETITPELRKSGSPFSPAGSSSCSIPFKLACSVGGRKEEVVLFACVFVVPVPPSMVEYERGAIKRDKESVKKKKKKRKKGTGAREGKGICRTRISGWPKLADKGDSGGCEGGGGK